jgi:hypothetical protein
MMADGAADAAADYGGTSDSGSDSEGSRLGCPGPGATASELRAPLAAESESCILAHDPSVLHVVEM